MRLAKWLTGALKVGQRSEPGSSLRDVDRESNCSTPEQGPDRHGATSTKTKNGSFVKLTGQLPSTTFDGLIPGLQAKRFDAAIAAMGVTKERPEVIDMVGYVLGGHAIATKAGNPLGLGRSPCVAAR